MITRVELHSFGYLHGQPGTGLVVDVRKALRDPHVDPAMRELTGLDDRVREHVLIHPSALTIVRDIVTQIEALLAGYANSRTLLVRAWVGCADGRHRSVAVVEAVATVLRDLDIGVDVVHEHIHLPVVRRDGA